MLQSIACEGRIESWLSKLSAGLVNELKNQLMIGIQNHKVETVKTGQEEMNKAEKHVEDDVTPNENEADESSPLKQQERSGK